MNACKVKESICPVRISKRRPLLDREERLELPNGLEHIA